MAACLPALPPCTHAFFSFFVLFFSYVSSYHHSSCSAVPNCRSARLAASRMLLPSSLPVTRVKLWPRRGPVERTDCTNSAFSEQALPPCPSDLKRRLRPQLRPRPPRRRCRCCTDSRCAPRLPLFSSPPTVWAPEFTFTSRWHCTSASTETNAPTRHHAEPRGSTHVQHGSTQHLDVGGRADRSGNTCRSRRTSGRPAC